MTNSDTSRKARLQWISDRTGQYAVRGLAGVSTFTLGITVSAMAFAARNIKEAPKSAEAGDSASMLILGCDASTLFFVAVGAIALFWFTVGGGRKPKVTRN